MEIVRSGEKCWGNPFNEGLLDARAFIELGPCSVVSRLFLSPLDAVANATSLLAEPCQQYRAVSKDASRFSRSEKRWTTDMEGLTTTMVKLSFTI